MKSRAKTQLRVVEETPIIPDPSRIATLPIIEESAELLLDCVATGAIGVLAGPAGSGKTVAFRRLAARYSSMGLAGECVYYCAQTNAGTTRGIKDLLMESGIGGAIIAQGHGASMQMIVKLALRDFKRRNTRCLLIDETQRLDVEAMQGYVALHDYLRTQDHPVALLVATTEEAPAWLHATDSARSRTLKILRSNYVDADTMMGLLAKWSEEFVEFSKQVDAGEKAASTVASLIHTHTAGNLRRLNFFTILYRRHLAGRIVEIDTVQSTLSRMSEEAPSDE